MASEPEDQRLQLFRDVAEADRKRKAASPPAPVTRPTQPPFDTLHNERGSGAGFYILLAICALIVMVVGGVYLTRRQNQQPQNNFAQVKTALPATSPAAPQTASAANPSLASQTAAPAQEANAAASSPLTASATPSATLAPAASAAPNIGISGTGGNSGSGDGTFTLPPPPTPIDSPNVFPAAPATQPAAAPPASSVDNFTNDPLGSGGGIAGSQNNAPAPTSDNSSLAPGTSAPAANSPMATPGASQTPSGFSSPPLGQ